MNNSKICVLYHYYEKDESYILNLRHFLKFGIMEAIDVYVIVAGGRCSIEIAPSDNLMVVSVENKNFDYGGYSDVLANVVDHSKYDYFIFVNSSVRGPFLPPYAVNDKSWFEYFIDLFSEDAGIVGVSINILNKNSPHYVNYERIFQKESSLAHVQTPVFALRRESFQVLYDRKFFDVHNVWSRDEVISSYEINLSRVLVNAGWNLKCLLPEFNQFDYRHSDLKKDCPDFMLGDMLFEGHYLGRTVHPYESMFVKTGRGLWPASYLETLAISMDLARGENVRDWSELVDTQLISSNLQWFKKKKAIARRFYRYLAGVLGK